MKNDNLELLLTMKDYGEKLASGIIRTSEYFQSYDEANGAELMITIIDGLQWFIEAAVNSSVLSNEDELNSINDKLKELVEAFENQDYVLIGDLLQYELLPIVQNINNNVVTYSNN
ncbi:hypothetical protein [Candidatus Clostridium radicumherbarum]|uniref:DUF8042 domain-containing protein n=1 Tax=Candidatus Clostridium radicumherbarum TaxID=3381662 RepID=A0ABW8TX95_9CLOT